MHLVTHVFSLHTAAVRASATELLPIADLLPQLPALCRHARLSHSSRILNFGCSCYTADGRHATSARCLLPLSGPIPAAKDLRCDLQPVTDRLRLQTDASSEWLPVAVPSKT